MAKAVIIKTDSTKELVEFTNETSYKTLSSAVGGYIQSIDFDDTITLWCNENGKLDDLPQNPVATAFWVEKFGLTDYVVGDVIFTGGTDDEGQTLGLSDEQVLRLLDFNRTVTLI